MQDLKALAIKWRDAHASVVGLIASGMSPKSKQAGMRQSAAKQAEDRFDAGLADAQAEIARLRGAFAQLLEMVEQHADFSNGVKCPQGIIDEGVVTAERSLAKFRKVLEK